MIRVLCPARPDKAGFLGLAAVMALVAVMWLPAIPTPVYAVAWFTAFGLFLLSLWWLLFATEPAHTPTK